MGLAICAMIFLFSLILSYRKKEKILEEIKINDMIFYIPAFALNFVIYYQILQGRQRIVKELESKETITQEDEKSLHVALFGEYIFFAIWFVFSYLCWI